jgi:UDP-glucose 4-epimerase
MPKGGVMNCLVTGAAGLIGSHLAECLLADGHCVRGVVAFIDYYPRHIKERNLEGPYSWNRFTFVEGNLLDVNLPPLLEGVDWIFHLAAHAVFAPGNEFEYLLSFNTALHRAPFIKDTFNSNTQGVF